MKIYRYVALDQRGQERQGNVEAEDRGSAGRQLRNQGLYVMEVNDPEQVMPFSLTDLPKHSMTDWVALWLPVSANHKVFFFRQIALMLRSGLSLTESMKTVAKLMSGRLRISIIAMLDDIQTGERLSNAVARHGSFFPTMAEPMIRSAEASGQLDEVMSRIADHMEHKAQLRRQVLTTMLYPVITMLLAIAMFVFLVTGVIPKFAKFFENSAKPIPAQTQSLLDLAAFMSQWGWLITFGLGLVAAAIAYAYKQRPGRLLIDAWLLKVPLVGSIIRLGAMSQATWSLAMLLRSGLALVTSLQIVAQLIGNQMIAQAFCRASEAVLRGRNLGESLGSPYIAPLVCQLAAVGERSGSLEQIMQEAGEFYQQALQARNKVLSSMIEPVAILIIGGMVAYVYIAFFKAIFAISGG